MPITLDQDAPATQVQAPPPMPSIPAGATVLSRDPAEVGLEDFESPLSQLFSVEYNPNTDQSTADPQPPPSVPSQHQPPSPSQQQQQQTQPPAPLPEQQQPPQAQGQEPTVEQLRAELEGMKGMADYLRSEEFKTARIVSSELAKDPVKFIREYLPGVAEELVGRVAIERADTAEAYALQFAEQELEKRYGAEFQFDAADAMVKGTPSYNYANDRQLLVLKGAREYDEYSRQQEYEEREKYQQAMEIARNQYIKAGHDPATASQAFEVARNYRPSLEEYYEMTWDFLTKKGKLAGIGTPAPAQSSQLQQTQQPVAPQPLQSRRITPPTPPLPGVQTVAAGPSEARQSTEREMVELFGPELF
jgi:hypothetical protein